MNKPLLIHYNNTKANTKLNQVSFEIETDNIDYDIVDFLETKIFIKEADVIVIKDSLSKNYLEFYGLVLAHHIRLSNNKKVKYLPIVIISDLNIYQLSKLTPLSNICYTEGIYLVDNELTKIDNILKKDLKGLDTNNFDIFLNLINIEPPSNYDSKHSIANEWGIYEWAKFLQIEDNKNINLTIKNITSMLYFKYLINKYPRRKSSPKIIKQLKKPKGDDNILYIDDECEKGWGYIFDSYLNSKNFKYIGKDFKEKKQSEIIDFSIKKINDYDPDLIILDLRLCDKDFKKDIKIKNITGAKILKKIKEINPGIQVLMFTASGDSLILDELHNQGILGYVKKDSPSNEYEASESSFNKFNTLINKGLDRKYLKEVWLIKKSILNIINQDPFQKFVDVDVDYGKYVDILKKEVEYFFYILQSNMDNKNKYAMVSIYTSFETIQKIFMKEVQDNYEFTDTNKTIVAQQNKLSTRIISILTQKLNITEHSKIADELKKIADKRNDYLHSNKKVSVSSENILDWLRNLDLIIGYIKSPLQKKIRKASAIRHV